MQKRRKKFKLHIAKFAMTEADKEHSKEVFKFIKQSKALVKKASKDTRALLQNEIKYLRENVVFSYSHKFYEVTLSLGPHKEVKEFSFEPTHEDIIILKNNLIRKISKNRASSKLLHRTAKEFQGIYYEMVGALPERSFGLASPKPSTKIMPGLIGGGNVFQESASIVALQHPSVASTRITRPKKPYDKDNYIGVELEVNSRISRRDLNELFIQAKLAGSVYVKSDSSIRPEKETDHPNEITLIAKEKNIKDIISRVCAVLNSKQADCYVNNSCGLHVHLDMRNRDPNVCYANLKNCLHIFAAMVPADRVDSDHGRRFCALAVAPTLEEAKQRLSRYHAINVQALQSHKTLELRLHSGSTNAMKINNWVELLQAVVAHPTIVEQQVNTPEDIQTYFGISSDLVAYIKMRMEKFKNRTLDTRKDHFEQAV